MIVKTVLPKYTRALNTAGAAVNAKGAVGAAAWVVAKIEKAVAANVVTILANVEVSLVMNCAAMVAAVAVRQSAAPCVALEVVLYSAVVAHVVAVRKGAGMMAIKI